MRAPLARTSSISSAWRGRSRMTTVRSRTFSRLALAIQRRFCDGVAVMSIDPNGLGTDGDLLHVVRRPGVEHRLPVADRDDRQGVRAALRGERRPVDRVDGHVDERGRAVADVLAVVEHRGVVLLALADDDDAVHRDGAEDRPHRRHGGPVGAVLVAPADPARGGQGRRLGDADQLHGEVAVRSARGRRHGRSVPVAAGGAGWRWSACARPRRPRSRPRTPAAAGAVRRRRGSSVAARGGLGPERPGHREGALRRVRVDGRPAGRAGRGARRFRPGPRLGGRRGRGARGARGRCRRAVRPPRRAARPVRRRARRGRPRRRVRARRVAGARSPDPGPGAWSRARSRTGGTAPRSSPPPTPKQTVDELLDAIEQGTLVLASSSGTAPEGALDALFVVVGPPGSRRRRPGRSRRPGRTSSGASIRPPRPTASRAARGPARSAPPRQLGRARRGRRRRRRATSSAPPRSCDRSCGRTWRDPPPRSDRSPAPDSPADMAAWSSCAAGCWGCSPHPS